MNKSFDEALANFLEVAQGKVNERFKGYFTQSGTISTEEGQKYIRVVISSGPSRSVFCFVNKATGDVLKAAGWATPEKKNVRSNIFDEDCGGSGITGYGAVYIRR